MADKPTYYVVETEYTGPNAGAENFTDLDKIEIRTTPAIDQRTGEPRADGYCGNHNDFETTACGAFDTLDEAKASITERVGEIRSESAAGEPFKSTDHDDDVVEIFKPGKYEPMSRSDTAQFVENQSAGDLQADSTDEKIAELVKACEAEVNRTGYTLDACAAYELGMCRDQLRVAAADSAEDEDMDMG